LILLASNSIDIKARKRIEQLFEITDEIINAYNEINEKYVNQIYRKYKQLQEVNKNLKEKLHHYHCAGCQCTIKSNGNEEDESSEEEEDNDDDQQTKIPAIPSSSTNSIITRSKKNNRSFTIYFYYFTFCFL
jgi:RNase P subunit RPR2